MKVRGNDSIEQISRIFHVFDEDSSSGLSFSEFLRGMNQFGLDLSEDDIRILFNDYDEVSLFFFKVNLIK